MSVPQKMKKGGLEKAFENKIKEGRKHRVKSQTHRIKSKPYKWILNFMKVQYRTSIFSKPQSRYAFISNDMKFWKNHFLL